MKHSKHIILGNEKPALWFIDFAITVQQEMRLLPNIEILSSLIGQYRAYA